METAPGDARAGVADLESSHDRLPARGRPGRGGELAGAVPRRLGREVMARGDPRGALLGRLRGGPALRCLRRGDGARARSPGRGELRLPLCRHLRALGARRASGRPPRSPPWTRPGYMAGSSTWTAGRSGPGWRRSRGVPEMRCRPSGRRSQDGATSARPGARPSRRSPWRRCSSPPTRRCGPPPTAAREILVRLEAAPFIARLDAALARSSDRTGHSAAPTMAS